MDSVGLSDADTHNKDQWRLKITEKRLTQVYLENGRYNGVCVCVCKMPISELCLTPPKACHMHAHG